MTIVDAGEPSQRNQRAARTARKRALALLASLLGVVLTLSAGTDAWAKGAAPPGERPGPRAETAGQLALGDATEANGGRPSAQATTLKETYAAREVSAKNLEKFRGGDVVIISSTTALVVLLVVLIIVVAA